MAIFGKADADLPLVTQLMQVDLANDDEVLRFWRRTAAHAELETVNSFARPVDAVVDADGQMATDATGESYVFVEPAEIVTFAEAAQAVHNNWVFNSEALGIEAEASGYASVEQYLLSQFSEACFFAQSIFASLHEDSTVPLNALAWLRRTFGAHNQLEPRPDIAAEADADKEREKDEVYVSLSDFMPAQEMGTVLPGFHLAAQVDEAITALWRKAAYLALCSECGNIFLARRAGQTYCSHRCGNRVSQRERVRRKKEGDELKCD